MPLSLFGGQPLYLYVSLVNACACVVVKTRLKRCRKAIHLAIKFVSSSVVFLVSLSKTIFSAFLRAF